MLTESLVGLLMLSVVVTLLVTSIQQLRQQRVDMLEEKKVLAVAQMALQSQQSQLVVDGIAVQVRETESSCAVIYQGKDILHAQKN